VCPPHRSPQGPRGRAPSFDSRALRPGACFVALRGTRDGHDFVLEALDRGALGALVSRRVEGAGLGLAIVKRLVEAMDGRVWVESELGRGACFSVELPSA